MNRPWQGRASRHLHALAGVIADLDEALRLVCSQDLDRNQRVAEQGREIVSVALDWLDPLRFTGKRSWRWEGAVRWRGERLPVSVWHDSSEPTRGGSRPAPDLQRAIERRLTKVLEAWPARREEFVGLFSRLRKRAWPKAPAVTEVSMGDPTVSLPNGVRGPRFDFEFHACRVFGPKLHPSVSVMGGGRLSAQLEPVRGARGESAVAFDEAKHVVPLRESAVEPKAPLLPPRAALEPVPLHWLSPLRRGDEEWRGRVAFAGRRVEVNSADEREPKAQWIALALGAYEAALSSASVQLAYLHESAGWGRRTYTPTQVAAKLRLLSVSLMGPSWTFTFADGGLFGGHRVEVWAEGRTAEVDLVG